MGNVLLRSRVKFPVYIIQITLVIAVLALSVVRMLNPAPGAPRSRANTMSLGMSAKSLVILAYEILSSHVGALKRFGNLRAYLILNVMEIVFWAAVVYLMINANMKFCAGISCTLSWVIVPMAICMSILALYMSVISFLDFRYFKHNGFGREIEYTRSSSTQAPSIEKDDSRRRQRPLAHEY